MSANLVPFLLLFVAFLLLWLPSAKRLWFYFFAAAVIAAIVVGVISITVLIAIFTFCGLCYGLRVLQFSSLAFAYRFILWTATVAMSLALALHLVPGFTPLVLYEGLKFSELSAEFTMRYHFDKALVGFLLIAIVAERIRSWSQWQALWGSVLVVYIVTLVAVAALGVMLGYFEYDPKISSLLLWWGLGNLFITCIAEEAFFRLLIQQPLQQRLSVYRYGALTALLVTSLLFGLVHAGGGWVTILGATVAGLGYGYVYLRTGRIEAAILVHFALNLTHFLFFTYPRSLSFSI